MRSLVAFLLLSFASAAAWATESAGPIPEPSSYRMSDYKAPTPATLDGKPGLTTAQAHELWSNKTAAFIDVLPQVPKPANLAPGTLWRDKPRFDIPGSTWLPDTGYGALAPAMEDYFRRGLNQATGGDTKRTLVFYCKPACWMSWNAAKRAESIGYANVLWYPGGVEEWSGAGFPLKEQPPLPRP